jgi:hypothetical protein
MAGSVPNVPTILSGAFVRNEGLFASADKFWHVPVATPPDHLHTLCGQRIPNPNWLPSVVARQAWEMEGRPALFSLMVVTNLHNPKLPEGEFCKACLLEAKGASWVQPAGGRIHVQLLREGRTLCGIAPYDDWETLDTWGIEKFVHADEYRIFPVVFGPQIRCKRCLEIARAVLREPAPAEIVQEYLDRLDEEKVKSAMQLLNIPN